MTTSEPAAPAPKAPRIGEIINMSDPYTILIGEDPMPACIAVLLLGEGAYSLRDENNESLMPLFVFGGHDAWLAEHGVPDLRAYLDANILKIADALDTVLVGTRQDRAAFERVFAAITSAEDRDAARRTWLNERRGSLNNIGGRAMALAERLRSNAATGKEG